MNDNKALIRKVSAVFIGLFILSLLPLAAISIYNRPCADDFTYGTIARVKFVGTGSVIAAIGGAFKTAAVYYNDWQGTFSASFFMSLQPAVFDEALYPATAFVMLFCLIAATFFLLYTLIVRVFGSDRKYVIIIGVPVLYFCIQYPPSLVQGFYWFNGAMFYTFYYSLLLAFTALCIRIYISVPTGKIRFAVRFVLAAFCCFIISGGNYVTALIAPIIATGFIALSFVYKKPASLKLSFFLLTVILLAGLYVSISAPGNAVRQAGLNQPGFIAAILMSFKDALKNINDWSDLKLISALLIISPALYHIAAMTNYSFKYPLLVLLFSFCLFAAHYAPPIYAMGWSGDGRLKNIIYFSYIWLVSINSFYFIGWLGVILRRHSISFGSVPTRSRAGVLAVAAIIFLASSYCTMYKSSAFICARDLIKGDARQYSAEMTARYDILKGNNRQILFEPLTVKPQALFFDDITVNKEDWRNTAIANFYQKDFVVLTDVEAA